MMRAFFGEWKQMEDQFMVLFQNRKHLNRSEIYMKDTWLYCEPEIIFARVVYNKGLWKDDLFFNCAFFFFFCQGGLGSGWRCTNKMLFCHSGITL